MEIGKKYRRRLIFQQQKGFIQRGKRKHCNPVCAAMAKPHASVQERKFFYRGEEEVLGWGMVYNSSVSPIGLSKTDRGCKCSPSRPSSFLPWLKSRSVLPVFHGPSHSERFSLIVQPKNADQCPFLVPSVTYPIHWYHPPTAICKYWASLHIYYLSLSQETALSVKAKAIPVPPLSGHIAQSLTRVST